MRVQIVAVWEDGASRILLRAPDTLRIYLIVAKATVGRTRRFTRPPSASAGMHVGSDLTFRPRFGKAPRR